MNLPDVDGELLALLPPILRAVVRALGLARAIDFLRDHGGINVHIPLHKTAALSLEADELARLRHTLEPHLDSNRRVTLPKFDKLIALYRNAAIVNGMARESIAQQARLYGLTSRHITNIRQAGKDTDQLDLFD